MIGSSKSRDMCRAGTKTRSRQGVPRRQFLLQWVAGEMA